MQHQRLCRIAQVTVTDELANFDLGLFISPLITVLCLFSLFLKSTYHIINVLAFLFLATVIVPLNGRA